MPQNNMNQQMGQQLLFPLNDPETAFRNAMRQAGINPYSANPFVNMLDNAAQGARIAFLGANLDNTDPSGNPSERYGQWLTNQLQGGGLFNTLQATGRNIYGLTGGLDRYVNQLNAGNAQGVSPYAAALRDIFSSDNGMGAASAYASLFTPTMGSGIGQAWGRGIRARAETGLANFANQGTPNQNIWNWILGSPGVGAGGGFF